MMYRIILAILFCSFSSICFAQHLTYSDIVKINRLSRISEISDFVAQRGYVYAGTSKEDSITEVYWIRNCSINIKTGDFTWTTGQSRSLFCLIKTNQFIRYDYELPSRNAYKALTASLKANSFKFQEEEISSDRISSTYKRSRGGKIDYAETNEKSGGSFSSSFWFNCR